ncbi:MAG: Ig-like domain-containing protein, partial [Coprobacillaceae bacterium]
MRKKLFRVSLIVFISVMVMIQPVLASTINSTNMTQDTEESQIEKEDNTKENNELKSETDINTITDIKKEKDEKQTDENNALNIKQIIQQLITDSTLPEGTSTSIIDAFTLSFYEKGIEPPKQVIKPQIGDTFNMEMYLKLPVELLTVLGGGEYYDFELPSELKITEVQTINLDDGVNTYGTITINEDGTGRILFNSNIKGVIEVIDAGGRFYGTLDKGNMDKAGTNEFKIPN